MHSRKTSHIRLLDEVAASHRQYQQHEKPKELIVAEQFARRCAKLHADNAVYHEAKGKKDVDALALGRVKYGGCGHHGHDLRQRGSDDHLAWNLQKLDQGRDHHETAANSQGGFNKAYDDSDPQHRQKADVGRDFLKRARQGKP